MMNPEEAMIKELRRHNKTMEKVLSELQGIKRRLDK